jgi:hypothetical protein
MQTTTTIHDVTGLIIERIECRYSDGRPYYRLRIVARTAGTTHGIDLFSDLPVEIESKS